MTVTPAIERAIRKASILHQGQVRRSDEKIPYVTHLFSVAALLSEYADKEDVIIGGLLHDSLEDTAYTEAELEEEFGKKVRDIVISVTEATSAEKAHQEISWKDKKLRYLEKLQGASAEALMVSAADKIHNLSSLMEDYKKFGSSIWSSYGSGKEGQLWFFESVLLVLEDRLESAIVPELRRLFEEAKSLFVETA